MYSFSYRLTDMKTNSIILMKILSFRPLLFALVAFLALGNLNTVLAQGGRGTPEEQKAAFDEQFEDISASLALDEVTKPKMKSILWSAQEKRMEMTASMRGGGGGNLARQGMRTKMNEINEATMLALTELLSEDQLEKYNEYVQANQRGRGQRGRGNGQQGNPQ